MATTPALRVLAAFVALLLTASALGQAAHFLLVPHTICAEHGELLELAQRASHQAAAPAGERSLAGHDRVASPDAAVEHEHCQALARGQREQALPPAPPAALLPATPVEEVAIFSDEMALGRGISRWLLAPKTSPPARALWV